MGVDAHLAHPDWHARLGQNSLMINASAASSEVDTQGFVVQIRHLRSKKEPGLENHPRFFDEQLYSAVRAIGYVRDSGN